MVFRRVPPVSTGRCGVEESRCWGLPWAKIMASRVTRRLAHTHIHCRVAGGPATITAMDKRYGAPVAGTETEVLSGFLDHYRRTLLQICDGLPEAQLRHPMVPSGMSLLGLVKHLTYVEYGWFHENVGNEKTDYQFDAEDPDADFRIEEGNPLRRSSISTNVMQQVRIEIIDALDRFLRRPVSRSGNVARHRIGSGRVAAPVLPSSSSRMMSACPACRAVSSIIWTTTQRTL